MTVSSRFSFCTFIPAGSTLLMSQWIIHRDPRECQNAQSDGDFNHGERRDTPLGTPPRQARAGL